MKKIVRLTESDLVRLVNRVINEQSETKEDFLKGLKKDFLKKGFQSQQGVNSLLSMKKGDYQVEAFDERRGNVLNLTNLGMNKELISISLKNYSMFGPFEVKYIKADKNGSYKIVKTEKLNGNEVGRIIEKFGQ